MKKQYKDPNENWYYHQKLLKSKDSYKACFYCIIAVAILILVSLFFTSCKSIQYVPVETVKVETIHNTDTLIVRDTINNEKETIIREASPADSLLLAKVGLQLDESKRIIILLQKELAEKSHQEIEHKTDTVEKIKEIQVPYPVEKQLTKWEKTKMHIGEGLVWILIVVFVVIIVGWLIKMRKRV